jgi:transketolase
LIAVRTHIGYGLPTRQDTAKAHGEPPGDEELNGAKEELGWPLSPRFYVPKDVLDFTRRSVSRGAEIESEWQTMLELYRQEYPELARELERRLKGELPINWDSGLSEFPEDPKGLATRAASGKVLNELASRLPELVGGSADLTPSNVTWIKDSPSFQQDTLQGRNFHFGVREHGMASIVNGMAVHGGIIPYGATFLVFSDYMRPALRLSALSHYPSIWVFTHDSIGLGEDGPTHQPVEQLTSLRAIPGMVVIRPADANEVVQSWKVAIHRRDGPTALAFTRQAVPTLDRQVYSPADGLLRGAYVLADLGDGKPELILMASGSEVSIIVEAGYQLASDGMRVRLISFPSWELFIAQGLDYCHSVLPPEIGARVSVEAGIGLGWERWVGDRGLIISIKRFGASAPYKTLFEKFNLTVEQVVEKSRDIV